VDGVEETLSPRKYEIEFSAGQPLLKENITEKFKIFIN